MLRRICRGLAIGAVASFVAALCLPAINDGGYKDGSMVVFDGNALNGFGCIFGAMIGFWLEPRFLVYLICNVQFILLTALLLRADSGFRMIRSLIFLICTVFPLHFVLTYSHGLYIGAYLWVLAFVLGCTAQWIAFIAKASVPAPRANWNSKGVNQSDSSTPV